MSEAGTPPERSSPVRAWFERQGPGLTLVALFVLLLVAGCSAMLVGSGGLVDGAAP